jgi:hypothetical protein
MTMPTQILQSFGRNQGIKMTLWQKVEGLKLYLV